MEHGRKVIVVPETMAMRLQNTTQLTTVQQQHTIPAPPTTEGSVQMPGDNLSRLDAKMHEIPN
ncbi:hypothetical protein TSAR_002692 [Trichomalopsis sarcophagae]|uniref:Uncharacterized protein n=1 Tax=Trichomalopsis sarcophagae TaxID=543379 RepID=A0A232ERP9_9HYME|nr:hypothetical protein TSAR_002692 [Trichomalopsis sarcophagae]